MAGSLEGRVAIITGASAGIGAACAWKFARAGAKVIINARRTQALSNIEHAIDTAMGVETVHPVPGDCADPKVVAMMFQAAADHFGRHADLVVVNAGRGLAGGVTTSDEAAWSEVIRTNVEGAARLMRVAAEEMSAHLEQAGPNAWQQAAHDIIVLGSTVGRHISPFSAMYGGTKFAVAAMAEALRRELAPKGIRVGLIEPGIVKSEFQSVAGYDADGFGKLMDEKGPVLVPDDIADLVLHMASLPPTICLGDVVIRGTRQDYP
jgi:NADP-dependent 3-hydroxy acid dehydrogenase YdfG